MLNWQYFQIVRSSLVVLAATVLLTACADYDLEIDAPILNNVGLLSESKKAPPLKERAPLVVPPSAQLPPPGAVAKVPDDMNWPDDPDVRAKKMAAAKAKLKEADEKQKGPWHKAINSALGTGSYQKDDEDKNPVPPESAQPEGGLLDSLSASNKGDSDALNNRVRDMVR